MYGFPVKLGHSDFDFHFQFTDIFRCDICISGAE